MSNPLEQFAQDPEAAKVLDEMRDARWRKARDAAKVLCKRDRKRYLPLLVEANAGLVRQLVSKGLLKDAGTVVDYLQTIAPPELVAQLRKELEAPTSDGGQQKTESGGAAWWMLALRADAELAAGREISESDQVAVDRLVADRWQPSEDGGEAAMRLAAELKAVRAACDATGDGRWDEAREELRGVPARSIFRHWRMFLRGIRCFFEGDRKTAKQCFAGLPPSGGPARAARTFAPELLPSGPAAPITARVPFLLAAMGQKSAWADPIISASTSWQAGKRLQSYKELRAGLKDAFPDYRPGLAGVLTAAISPYSATMSDADHDFADELAMSLGAEMASRRPPTTHGLLALMRSTCITNVDDLPSAELEGGLNDLLVLWTRCEGASAERDSLAWQWLGEVLSRRTGERGHRFGMPSSPANDEKIIRQSLEKSVECDPKNEEAWLLLLAAIERQGDSKRHNELLGELTKRFPKSKKILRLAGDAALDRGTLTKSLTALKAALALDPLDRKIKNSMVIALVEQVRGGLKKGQSVAKRWPEMEPLLEDRSSWDFPMLTRWIARVRQGLLDPDPESAEAARQDAIRLAPTAVERLFLEELMALIYSCKPRKEWKREFEESLEAADVTWQCFARLIELANFSTMIRGWNKKAEARAEQMHGEALRKLMQNQAPRDPSGLLDFVANSNVLAKSLTQAGFNIFKRAMMTLSTGLGPAIRTGKWKKADPRLTLARLFISELSNEWWSLDEDRFLREIRNVVKSAKAAGMDEVVSRAEAMQARVEAAMDDYDAPFGSAEDFADGDFGAGNPMSSLLDVVGRYAEACGSGDPVAMAAARAELVKVGAPNEVIREIEELAAGNQARPQGKKAKKTASAKKPPTPPDPNQLDLF